MNLMIDGRSIVARPGQSLLDLVRELGLDDKECQDVLSRQKSPARCLH